MTRSTKKSRMFEINGKRMPTWNLVVGCNFNCTYCWARIQAKRQKHRCEKCYNFEPHFHKERLNIKKMPSGDLIFINDMGDWLGYKPTQRMRNTASLICGYLSEIRNKTFLSLTKNPIEYLHLNRFPKNMILGATIETDLRSDLEYKLISYAPPPLERIYAMQAVAEQAPKTRRIVSIEPILTFSSDFAEQIREIRPEFVYVGYATGKHELPEPPLAMTKTLIRELRKFTTVYEKSMRKAWYEP